jgi:tRNA1Val (adenine37-N6)-methyltransferase
MRLSNDPVDRATRKRPLGWRAPGPPPRGALGRPDLEPRENEVLSFLSGDYRIFQRKDGHRWSLDDFMTAMVALEEGRAHGHVQTACDLGCGIGSVLMFVAWGFPTARCVGVEAQELSCDLLRRSLAFNGAEDRCEVRMGDLRSEAMFSEKAAFDLVTGTPPYIPLGRGTESAKVQRGPCCFETRGGIEAYAESAARLLSRGGVFVACSGTWPQDRAIKAGESAGLACTRRVSVIGKEGKPPLFVVTAMCHKTEVRAPLREEVFRARMADGSLPPEMHAARALLGLPPVNAS